MGITKIGLAALALSLSLPAAKACACSCVSRTEAEQVESADAVFEGIAVERRDSGSAEEWIFEVDRVIKGDVSDPQSIWAETYSTCSIRFEIGRSYRVFGDIEEGRMSTGLCTGTRPVESDEPPPSASPEAREPASPEPSQTPAETIEPVALPAPRTPSQVPPLPPTPPTVQVTVPPTEYLTLGSSLQPRKAAWPAAGTAGSIAILTAGVLALRRWKRSKQR